MSRPDLQALFRSNDPHLRAVDVFSDRETEWFSVVESIEFLQAVLDSESIHVEDLEAPRRNVLVFYGVGGIGKTALSRALAAWLADHESGPPQWQLSERALPKTVPVRIDLSRSQLVDFETILLMLRAEFSSMSLSMPAFDLAFRRYWDYNHPGESLEEHLRAHASLRRFSASLPGQIDSVLNDAAQALGLPGTIGALAGKALLSLIRVLRQRQQQVRALRCHRLPDLLEAEPGLEALSYYPHLLAWDLAQLSRDKKAIPVILLDTFEDIGDRANRERECLIQRLVWLMPNALFVITGRNRLQWDDARLDGELDWAGIPYWPQLGPDADHEPRQHLVGYLSGEDCDNYLARRLSYHGRPLIPASIRSMIATRSEGLPLYLDLAVMRFLSLYQRRGTVPDMGEFDYDFVALVNRTFRDLSSNERHVARAISLIDSFSIDLATAGAGLSRDSAAIRLTDRPFVEHDPSALWPYRLHNLVRSVIRDSGAAGEDSWSNDDWCRAAQRLFDALGAQWREANSGSNVRLTDRLSQGLRLARDFDLALDWLIDASFVYVRDAVWQPLKIGESVTPRAIRPAGNGQAIALETTLNAICGRNRKHRQATADELRAVIESGQLPDELVELPTYYLAMCDRDLGNLDASLTGMGRVVDIGGRLAADAARGLLHLSRRLGRFRDALAIAESLGADGKQHRALGELWWSQGHIPLACASLTRARDEALAANLLGEAALCQAYLAFATAFEDRPRALEQIERATTMLGETPISWASAQVEVASLIADAGYDGELPSRANAVAAAAQGSGLSSPSAYALLAASLHAAVMESWMLYQQAHTLLQARVQGAEFAYLVEISSMFVQASPPDGARADWIEGEATARRRWHQLVQDRRRQIATTGRD